MDITTPEHVQAVTGRTVTPEDIATAVGVVEAMTGVDLSADAPPYTARDLRHLRTAVVWQTVYLLDHPDVLTRESNLTSASTNGASLSWDASGSGGAIMAPLARVALRRVSWRRSKTLRMVKGRPVPLMREGFPQTLVSDGSDVAWKPLR